MTWNSVEKVSYAGISATPASFVLRGGCYAVMANATWGGGSVTLQRLSSDGSTYVTVLAAFSADGYQSLNLPAGTYRFLVATATAITAEVIAVVTTQ